MHAIEKLLAAAAKKESVRTGEIVECDVDVAGINDLYLQAVKSFYEMGGTRVKKAESVVVFLDHYAPASTVAQAENQKAFRDFCAEQGIANLMDINAGVCHQILADKGFSKPGKLIVVTDSHTTTHGAFGAFGTGVGATDMAIILLTGRLWFKVPEIIKIELTGAPKKGVSAKDVILHIIGSLKADYAIYKAVEFAGEYVSSLSVSERMALCNMTTEMGAKTAYIQPDATTIDFLNENGENDYRVFETDEGYEYAERLRFDVAEISPTVAAPSSVDNVFALSRYAGTPVDQAYLGSCTGGRVEDIRIAASILEGKRIAKNTRFLLVPASQKVLLEAMEKGYIQTLVKAGATLVTPGCASCLGTHEGIIASGETCISSTNRNFPGRMGHREGAIFLASPAAVAASALNGCITDPSEYV
ncbi:3-isopropylmalate dehydratase large subunit [Christensenellaceae bacterium OttesenSCG-928-M15]|nr:3-isopropylmalate dehydratase large subunit [Christensenellaceae bacterium OttesenSCG-928-M15]